MKNVASWAIVVFVIVVVCAGLGLLTQFAYFWTAVEENQLGVRLQAGRILEVVDPGIYSDTGYRVDLEKINVDAVPFSHTDQSILTKDKQKVGLTISGDIFRPNDKETLRNLWPQYKNLYLDDALAIDRLQKLSGQAMKVCVGNRNFDDAIIGTARDETRACIDEELNRLSEAFGLRIANVVIPDVTMSPEAEAALDAIVQSRLKAEEWAQNKRTEEARTTAELAKEKGKIIVEQGRLAQQAESAAEVAVAEEAKIKAQKAVIQAEAQNRLAAEEADFSVIQARKANELESAELDKAISTATLEVAILKAKASQAEEEVLAGIIHENPGYGTFLNAKVAADALSGVEKIFMVPEGTDISVLSTQAVPTIDTESK